MLRGFQTHLEFCTRKIYAAWYPWRTFFRISMSENSEVLARCGSITCSACLLPWNNFFKISWLSISMFNISNLSIAFCRRGNLSIGNSLKISARNMPISFFRNYKNGWLSNQKEEFTIKKVRWSKSIVCF